MKPGKVILWAVAAVFLLLIVIVITRTFRYPFRKAETGGNAVTAEIVPGDKALRRLSGGIRIPTVSRAVYGETDFAPFDAFKSYLAKSYPEVYRAMDTLTINEYGLVFRWKGKKRNLKPVLFLSHYDVVPVMGYDPPTEAAIGPVVFRPDETSLPPVEKIQAKWDYPPFSGAVANGRIYGRGTLDMKGMLFSLLEAADTLLSEGFAPERDIWFAFGQDEENGGRQGAVRIAEYLQKEGIAFEAVFDEGGIIASPQSVLEEIDRPLGLVGLGEKGFLTLRLRVHGLGGHSSMPPKRSSLVNAAVIIERLNGSQMPARIIPPVQAFLDNIGGEMSYVQRTAIANQWLLKPLLLSGLGNSPASNALIRTTTAISMAKGSDAPNVLSSVAEVVVNFRLLPGDSVAAITEHVRNLCEGYKVDIEPAVAREASGLTPEHTEGFTLIEEGVAALYPSAIVSSYITIGGTDAYKYQLVSDNIYRFMPVCLNEYEQRTIHNENEYISFSNYGRMIAFFKGLMIQYGSR